MIDDLFKELWREVDEARRVKIETAVEQMLTDPQQRGVLIVQNQWGVVLSADLSSTVPFGQVFIRTETDEKLEALEN